MKNTSLTEYENFLKTTQQYPNIGSNLIYTVLGLVGEAGEVAEKIKKNIRNDDGVLDAKVREELLKELGDVLWYVVATANELGYSFEEVASKNIEKLTDRMNRGVIKSAGDNR